MNNAKKALMGLSMLTTSLVAASASAQTVTIGLFGGNWGEAFNTCVSKPFTEKTGIAVVPEVGTSAVSLAKLQQQKNAPIIDAVWMDSGVSELAMEAGVVDDLKVSEIPNLANLVEEGIYKHQGITFAASTGFYAVGLAYNTQQVKQPPKSWSDLWSPEFADALTFPSPANALGVPTLIYLNSVLNLPDGMDGTFAMLKKLKAGQYYDSSGVAANGFQSGEVIAGVYNSPPTWDLNDRGVPLTFVAPKEGAWGGDVRLHLVKGAPNKEAAEKFINQALTPEASACLAQRLHLGPSIAGTQVDEATASKLPWGAAGSVKSLKLLDWWEVNSQRASLISRWNREIAK